MTTGIPALRYHSVVDYADTRRAVETALGHGLKSTAYLKSGSVGPARAISGGDLAALNAIG